ncbi:hypothetical protein RFF05_06570 [Bengtsoniella intestinalis]|uniref:hypothetical protein n=1 Tax=Bengtsoniella intestinalis TaxID=3073143 RepID=UPI00391F4CED
MEKIMYLCVPCAEGLKDSHTVAGFGGTKKITCENCNRRRYGRAHKVNEKSKRKEG